MRILMFIFREKDLTAAYIVKMEGNKTSITNMKVPPSKHARTHTVGRSRSVILLNLSVFQRALRVSRANP